MKKLNLLFLLFFGIQLLSAQDMQEGFGYLEQGNFAKAETFFEAILKEYPDNKTANLCYGRAVGLNGEPQKATSIFTELLEEYPGDIEIELNYAESLLWGSHFNKAKEYYSDLVQRYPENFAALLGFANTLSNLKEYDNALLYVNRALETSPDNPNAMVSKKYIRLGFAYQKMQNQEYEPAISLLNKNLEDFSGDRETLLNKANIYLITKETEEAKNVYLELAKNAKDSIVALNGMALAAHIAENEKEAQSLAGKAIEKAEVLGDSTSLQASRERYAQTLVWNKDFKNAEAYISELITTYGEENWVLSLRATLGMYRSDFKKSIADYQQILEKDTASFDGNLGIANAYFADGETKNAYDAAYQTLKVFPNQKDATNFIGKLDRSFTPVIEEKINYTFDNGDNKAYATNTNIEFPVSTKLSFNANYNYRKTRNSITENEASSNNFSLGGSYKFHPKASFHVLGGINSANSFSNNYNQFLAQAFFKIKPYKLQDLEVGYNREVQNFNADLLDREIVVNNYYMNYNMGTNFNLGWFTQYYYSSQSDENSRNLLFTSLYYNFLSKPVLKGGINYQFLSFKNQVPTIYFSPSRFNAVEVFADFLMDENAVETKGLFYGLTAAVGYQFIEDDPKQSTYRIQGKFGYKFSERCLANFYGTRSNIASATAAGFTFTEIGFRLKWIFLNKPVFETK